MPAVRLAMKETSFSAYKHAYTYLYVPQNVAVIVRRRVARELDNLRGRPAPQLKLHEPVLSKCDSEQAAGIIEKADRTVLVYHPSTANQRAIAVIAASGIASSDGVVRLFA